MEEARVTAIVDKEAKIKASFIVKTKGKDLSSEIRELINNLAKEYDEKR